MSYTIGQYCRAMVQNESPRTVALHDLVAEIVALRARLPTLKISLNKFHMLEKQESRLITLRDLLVRMIDQPSEAVLSEIRTLANVSWDIFLVERVGGSAL